MVNIRYTVPPKLLPLPGYYPKPFPCCALNTPVKNYWSYRSISICEVKAINVHQDKHGSYKYNNEARWFKYFAVENKEVLHIISMCLQS